MFLKKLALRLKNNTSGETLIETLSAMVIVALAMLMLAGAIASSARVNKASSEENDAVSTVGEQTVTPFSVSVSHDGSINTSTYPGSTSKTTVSEYKTEAGYYYYDCN